MKNLKILLLGLLVAFFAVSSANAQTFQEKVEVYAFLDYECNGEYGWVEGSMIWHMFYHFDNEGYVDWSKLNVNAKDLVNLATGEKFKLNYKFKDDYVDSSTWHFNLRGDMGTHLIYSITWEFDSELGYWVIVDEKSKCL